MALPEPKSAQLNRFYTREFFQIVAGKLTPGGVFSFALTGAETSLSPLRAAYLAMAYHTLGQVFPEVAAFPGGQVRFFASPGRGVLVTDPEVLVQRLKIRQLPLAVRPGILSPRGPLPLAPTVPQPGPEPTAPGGQHRSEPEVLLL